LPRAASDHDPAISASQVAGIKVLATVPILNFLINFLSFHGIIFATVLDFGHFAQKDNEKTLLSLWFELCGPYVL
jgi:hypothetical protein